MLREATLPHLCPTKADIEFESSVYEIGAPILFAFGIIGNFSIIAILLKHRFSPFPVVTLVKSHAITNIFCLFIGKFIIKKKKKNLGYRLIYSCCLYRALPR